MTEKYELNNEKLRITKSVTEEVNFEELFQQRRLARANIIIEQAIIDKVNLKLAEAVKLGYVLPQGE